ncbi:MAG TPA: tail fiber protein [Candidatus Limnocylindria bacterium]|jgi:microcystin-dependent protein|nr:tail fiber protein [Candidatus Limnocylindria bacterium]
METFVGTILPVGFNFAPNGWLPCDGRLLPISQYEVLYALIGTTYGGDGQSTFGLPDLRGRIPIAYGQGPGQPNYVLGQKAGQMEATILSSNMPAHNHLVRCGAAGTTNVPAGNFPADLSDAGGSDLWEYTSDPTSLGATWNLSAVSTVGGSLPVDTVGPYQVINYIIAYVGIYPQQG